MAIKNYILQSLNYNRPDLDSAVRSIRRAKTLPITMITRFQHQGAFTQIESYEAVEQGQSVLLLGRTLLW